MIIENLDPFIGIHCETTATGTLLKQLNIELSEAMIFGLGEGLGFIFWNMKSMGHPFIGGRVKSLDLTKNLANNLNLRFEAQETTSVKKAWNRVKAAIDAKQVVGLQLDSYHLEYFDIKFHFAGHFAAIYGYDEHLAYMVDTSPNGSKVETSLESLALARAEKGPMAAKNLMYTLQKTEEHVTLTDAIVTAITNNAMAHLNPPIKNIGYKGILKTSTEIKKWFARSSNIEDEFCTTAFLMEKAGTGGALFRNLYRDFLLESYNITKIESIHEAYQDFVDIAARWTDVIDCFEKVGQTQDEKHINDASEILIELSEKEHSTMKKLTHLTLEQPL
jgi:hypothetical protein